MTDNQKLTEARERLTAILSQGERCLCTSPGGSAFVDLGLVLDAVEGADPACTPTDDERMAAHKEAKSRYGRGEQQVRRRVAFEDGAAWAADRRPEVPEPSTAKLEWPDHWTQNEKLRDLHARWHDQPGNLLGREACGWDHCEFWDVATFTLRLANAESDPEKDERLVRYMAMVTPLGYHSALTVVQKMTALIDAETRARAVGVGQGGEQL